MIAIMTAAAERRFYSRMLEDPGFWIGYANRLRPSHGPEYDDLSICHADLCERLEVQAGLLLSGMDRSTGQKLRIGDPGHECVFQLRRDFQYG